MEISSGILVYRKQFNKLQVFLGKCGGPLWEYRKNAWNIPKGHVEEGENLFETAKREFQEETSLYLKNKTESDFIYLGETKTKHRKTVHIYAIEYNFNDDELNNFKSNTCETEYPKNSGNIITIPELSEGKYFDIDEAKDIIFPYQKIFLDKLEEINN